jgi:hypothetical protein
MAKLGTVRGWAAVCLAAFLTFAILIPTIDTFVCIDDIGQSETLAFAGNDAPAPPPGDGDASCIHGHCHHWVGVPKIGERLTFDVKPADGRIPPGLYGPPPSAPQIELLRPPRA